MKCDICNGTGYIKVDQPSSCELSYTSCPKCDGQGRYDENNCRKEIDRYGVTRYCDRPKGHKGNCMTWNEHIASTTDPDDTVIPAG